MPAISVINTITVPDGMTAIAEETRAAYIDYFSQQAGYVSSTFYKALEPAPGGATKYVNIVVWADYAAFEAVVNLGFSNAAGENADGMKVLGRGFPEPIVVSPGRFTTIATD